jgi:serine/threonine protein phosphatase PrpC
MFNHLRKLLGKPKTYKFTTAALSKTGGRDHNEDAFGSKVLQQQQGCWVVADGLGGHGAGEVASVTAVQSILTEFSALADISSASVRQLLAHANQAILTAQSSTLGGNDMGTTAVLLIIDNERVLWGHVGDSRLYRFRGKHCTQLTEDHSMAQILISLGEITVDEVRNHPDRNTLLHSLGRANCRIDVAEPENLKVGDTFLLCSDGFWDYLLEEDMLNTLQQAATLDDWLNQLEKRLLKQVEKLGKLSDHDNYTAQAIRITLIRP